MQLHIAPFKKLNSAHSIQTVCDKHIDVIQNQTMPKTSNDLFYINRTFVHLHRDVHLKSDYSKVYWK